MAVPAPSNAPQFSRAELSEISAAIAGAMGWIAATTNEGNNQTSKYTRERLADAGRIVRWMRDGDAQ